jgi:hypothetical protein
MLSMRSNGDARSAFSGKGTVKWSPELAQRVRGWMRRINLAVEVWNLTPKEPSK